jgi:serine/threonine-protein kinase HipA
MFDAVSRLVSPAERSALLDGVIFNVLICNSDSHAKNYSILIGAGGTAKMAPLYDLMCAAIYPNVDQSLPQGIAGRFAAAELNGSDWRNFAEEVGLSGASTVRRVKELAALVDSNCDGVAADMSAVAGDPSRVLERIVHEVKKRCGRILRQV